MSFLVFSRGPRTGKRTPLIKFPVTIGRDTSNDISVMDDEEVSRFHARLKQRGRLFVVEDLESRNGTYVNGDRILNSIVKNGDRILIGSTELVFLTAEPDIRLSTEIMQFDMVVSEEMGLSGPIDVGEDESPQRRFSPVRLGQLSAAHKWTLDAKSLRTIFELQGNIMVCHDMDEAAKTLLKYVGKLMPNASRAALFVWSIHNRQLIPATAKHFGKVQSFLISQRALEDVVARKQGVILQADGPQVTQPGRHRLILPMTHNDIPICLLHIECDHPAQNFEPRHIEMVQVLLDRCAAIFESMLLRKELDGWLIGMIETMIATVEAKDTYTRGHSERVSRYSIAIADELKLNREIKQLLLVSSLCHDIGKIGIPDEILKKASLLSAEEYEEMKMHPTVGAEIMSHMPNAHRFISGVKYHHEKWDGTGYPEGLEGEEIPFFGRIVAVADVFDAMVSGRSYSGFLDQAEAVGRLTEETDLFDPSILKAFVRAYENGTLSLKTDTQNQEPETESEGETKTKTKNSKQAVGK